jgi:hypothetical protein
MVTFTINIPYMDPMGLNVVPFLTQTNLPVRFVTHPHNSTISLPFTAAVVCRM